MMTQYPGRAPRRQRECRPPLKPAPLRPISKNSIALTGSVPRPQLEALSVFQGDIAQFAPADLLLFLCHMNKEGVLTVRRDDDVVSVSFRGNLLVDAVSDPGERLILERLNDTRALSDADLGNLARVREETGLPVARICENLGLAARDELTAAVRAGLDEAVFRLLLWDRGSFQFTEIPVDPNPYLMPCEGQALVLDLTREVDEYRELVRGLGSLERRAFAAGAPPEATAEERYVLAAAGDARSVGALLEAAPYPQLRTAQAVTRAIDRGWIELAVAGEPSLDGAAEDTAAGAFPAYRQALRRMLLSDDRQVRLRELVVFAQAHCDQSILLAVGGGHLRRATVYGRDANGRLTASDHRDARVQLGVDLVFQQALASGRPFLGRSFPSPILDALGAARPHAACALLPLGRMGQVDLLLHAAVDEPGGPTGPLVCLELLSWQVRPPQVEPVAPASTPQAASGPAGAGGAEAAVAALVAGIKELPPMPQVASEVLALLAQPESSLKDLTGVLSRDPALVARLIKVSNSSLYGGYQQTGSLDQAIVRLGTRTTRSVVVAASTRTLFPLNRTRVGLLGRELWRHAVHTGLAARRVAEFTRRADPDEAFTAGVLHDLGKVIILLNRPDEFADVHRQLEAGTRDSIDAERERLGYDHGLVGERLLEAWGMPGNLVAVARWHHDPAGAGAQAPLVQVVACGDLLSHGQAKGEAVGEWHARRLAQACAALDLDERAQGDLVGLLALDLEQGDLLD
ncbi:MAG: HDOD domain-containing protein [Candidatus Krumholzibacteriia bacterium]